LTRPPQSICPECGRHKEPHRVCGHCGHYKGREIVAGSDDD